MAKVPDAKAGAVSITLTFHGREAELLADKSDEDIILWCCSPGQRTRAEVVRHARAPLGELERAVVEASVAFYEERGDLSNTGQEAECAWVDAVLLYRDALAAARKA